MAAINFVKDRRKKLTAQQQLDHKLFRIASYVLAGCFAVFLVVIGARLYFARSAQAVIDDQTAVKRAIENKEEIEADYSIFAQKLKVLSELFGQRKNKQEALLFFGDVFGPDITVSGIDYTASEDGILSFTIKAPSVFYLDGVFDVLEGEEVTTKYSRVQKSTLNRASDGSYSLKLTVVFADANIGGS